MGVGWAVAEAASSAACHAKSGSIKNRGIPAVAGGASGIGGEGGGRERDRQRREAPGRPSLRGALLPGRMQQQCKGHSSERRETATRGETAGAGLAQPAAVIGLSAYFDRQVRLGRLVARTAGRGEAALCAAPKPPAAARLPRAGHSCPSGRTRDWRLAGGGGGRGASHVLTGRRSG